MQLIACDNKRIELTRGPGRRIHRITINSVVRLVLPVNRTAFTMQHASCQVVLRTNDQQVWYVSVYATELYVKRVRTVINRKETPDMVVLVH